MAQPAYPVSNSTPWDTSLKTYVDGVSSTQTVAATAAFTAVANAVNTTGKFLGRKAYNSTTHKTVTASGPAAADPWYDESGAVAHTPA